MTTIAHKTAALSALTPHLTNYLYKTNKGSARKLNINKLVTFSYGLLHADVLVLAD